MLIFDQHEGIVSEGRVDVDRDATHSSGSLREDQPLAFLIGEVDVIRFVVYLEVQLILPVCVPEIVVSS